MGGDNAHSQRDLSATAQNVSLSISTGNPPENCGEDEHWVMAWGLLGVDAMKRQLRVRAIVFGTFYLLLASAAVAQPNAAEPAEGSSKAPHAAPAPVATPAAPSPVASTQAVAAPGSCRLGEHAGIDDADAQTATSIVCRELPLEARSSGLSYRVDLEKLGTAMFLSLSAESNGQLTDSRRAKLNAIEDVPTVAPHLVDALVHQKTLKDTEKVGNLTSADASAPIRRSGQFQVGVGILGAVVPGIATISPGAQLALHYDTPRWVLTTQFRFAVNTDGENRFDMTQLGVGPRYMLSTEDTSLFVGGGMVIESLRKSEVATSVDGYEMRVSDRKGGIGAYGEIGVEMMRLHKNRLNVALRADFPAFSVGGDYLVPISLSTSFVFD